MSSLFTEPITTFASITLGNVTIDQAPTLPKHAVTVQYVESEINKLINSAPGTLDTLGEIATALQASDSNVAGAISTSIAAVATSVSVETTRALAAEAATDALVLANLYSIDDERTRAQDEEGRIEALVSSNSQAIQSNSEIISEERTRAEGEEGRIEALVSSNSQAIQSNSELLGEEQTRAQDEEGRIEALVTSNSQSIQSNTQIIGQEETRAMGEEGRIEGLVNSNSSSINVLSGSKFNKAGGDINGNVTMNGNMQLPSSYYLYIGTNWRIEAYGTELHFRYSADGVSWGSGIPFVSV